jgi:hypothetical protein
MYLIEILGTPASGSVVWLWIGKIYAKAVKTS